MEKVQDLLRQQSDFIAVAAHEFRTPLTVISGMATLMEEDPATAKDLINRNSRRLLGLVNQMLDLAKVESGHLKLELQQADIVPYIQYLFESFESLAAGKNIQLVFQKESEAIVMDFDEKRMESIVSNLLFNAIKFTPEGGEVRLTLARTPAVVNDSIPAQLHLKIADTGIGIAPDKLPHVFDRFYQVDGTSTRKGEGTGIGLTLTQELVALMEGQIQVQSPAADGIGTLFTVMLPIRQQAPVSTPNAEASGLLPSSTPLAGSSITFPQPSEAEELPLLLLIEDNVDVAIYIRACLKDRYTVEWAVNGAIGIEKALELIPDIIISDVMMPEKDGFEVCEALKNDERTSHIPIVLLTAKADIDSRLEGLSVGADAYLAKPFLKEELFIRLAQLVALRRKLQQKYTTLLDSPTLEAPPAAPTEPSLDDLFLQKIHDLVMENLSEVEFGNEQLAQHMQLSQSQLYRKLKALTNRSVSIHIRSIRLQKGKELLENSDLTVSEIAYETGFTSPSYFSNSFTKEFGVSPSDVRK